MKKLRKMKLGRVVLIVATAALGMASGCGSGSAVSKIGIDCSDDKQCGGMGFCTGQEFCSVECDAHEDCGCPMDTTNGDVADGACDVGCDAGRCTRVCNNDSDCNGRTRCVSGFTWSGCA